ncbi:FeoB-associated Cys-rich membrane protein [Thiovibrio sp. JS02]
MWDNILLFLIIATCAFFIGRRLHRQLSGKSAGCGGCTGCASPGKESGPCGFPEKKG